MPASSSEKKKKTKATQSHGTESGITKKKRGRAPNPNSLKAKLEGATPEERKEIMRKHNANKMRRLNIKDIGLGEDQCSYMKILFTGIQNKVEGGERGSSKRTIARDSVVMLDNLREHALDLLLKKATIIGKLGRKKTGKNKTRGTLNARKAVNAIRLALPVDICQKALEAGAAAVERYNSSRNHEDDAKSTEEDNEDAMTDVEPEKKKSRGAGLAACGLTLSVTRTMTGMRERCTFSAYSREAAIYITAAIQVIMEKICLLVLLGVAQNGDIKVDKDGNMHYSKINPRDIRNAVVGDGSETSGTRLDLKTHFTKTGFREFFSNVTWSQTGTEKKEIAV